MAKPIKKIIVGALSALAVAAGGVLTLTGAPEQARTTTGWAAVNRRSVSVEVSETVREKAVNQMDKSGAGEDISCRLGGAINYPDRVWCSKGSAGFFLQDSADLVAEVDAAEPGLVSDSITLRRLGERLIADSHGVIATE